VSVVVTAALLGAVALLGAARAAAEAAEAADTGAPTTVAERHPEVVHAASTAPTVRAVRVTAGPTAVMAIAVLVTTAGTARGRGCGRRDWWLLVLGCWRVAVPWSGSPLAARRGPPAAPAIAPAIA
jgi:hypothetical protein